MSPSAIRRASPSTMAVLPDPRVADEDGVVLRPSAQDLDDPADLVVPADDRIELALPGRLGEVAPVLLEGVEGRLGVGARHPLVAADRLEGGEEWRRR